MNFQSLKTGAFLLCVLLLSSLSNIAIADDFPALRNTEADSTALPMIAADAAKSMTLPNGFVATVFASEPEVQNPIAMNWDSKGRLWVAENFTYAERTQRFDLSFRDRVLVFTDHDDDGIADARTVFTDQVQMLTSVEIGHGGVWLMCPPQVLFIPDADQDLVPDGPAQIVLDGFTVSTANYHNFANGLRFGPDGWLYGRCGGSSPGRIGTPGQLSNERVALEGGIWRYHPIRKTVETICAGTTNPWGHDWNEFGELFFVNTVNGHFWQGIPGAHFHRPFNLDPNPRTYETIDTHADHYHFDTGKAWSDSRDGAANSLGGGHAHCGAMFYLGSQWPEKYRGKFFTSNFHGRRLNQETVTRKGSGFVASHNPDFCIVSDPFYRGMDLSVAPDGSVMLTDWSDTGECHESNGVHRTSGRIYKISYPANMKTSVAKNISELSEIQLVDLHTGDNEWAIRKARLVLQERLASGIKTPSGTTLLQNLSLASHELHAVRAAMTLVACGQVSDALAQDWLKSKSEYLRAWGVRAMFDSDPIDDVYGNRHSDKSVNGNKLSTCVELAKVDPSGHVRLAIASTIQRLPVSQRTLLAKTLMQRSEDANDHNLPLLVWYGLMPVADSNLTSLVEVAVESTWPKTQRLVCRRIAESMNESMESTDQLLSQIAKSDNRSLRENVVGGIADAMKGWAKAPKPKSWQILIDSVKEDETSLEKTCRELGVVFGDGRAMDEIRELVLSESTEIGLRRSALIAFVNQKPTDLPEVCAKLLGDQRLSAIAAKGMAANDNSDNAKTLIKFYGRYRGTDRPGIISILTSRKSFASELIAAIKKGSIPKTDLSAYDARQIRSFGDESLNSRLSEAWGETRESPQDRIDSMQLLKRTLTTPVDGQANLGKGRVVFAELCGKCHRMYGEGQKIGPDLTGSNRNNLDYLIENIIDPSAVVSADYRVTILRMTDDRVLTGVIVTETDRTVSLQTQTELLVIEKEEIDERKPTLQSPMPEGQLNNLSSEQIRNLFAYLQHPSQVSLP